VVAPERVGGEWKRQGGERKREGGERDGPWFLIIENRKGKKNCPKMSVGDGKRPSPTFHTNGKFTHTVSCNGAPQTDSDLNNETRKKIIHYKRLYADLPDPSPNVSGWTVRVLVLIQVDSR